MNVLTREEAIKRIKDIDHNKSCDHLKPKNLYSDEGLGTAVHRQHTGAIKELMAIFDIKESEL